MFIPLSRSIFPSRFTCITKSKQLFGVGWRKTSSKIAIIYVVWRQSLYGELSQDSLFSTQIARRTLQILELSISLACLLTLINLEVLNLNICYIYVRVSIFESTLVYSYVEFQLADRSSPVASQRYRPDVLQQATETNMHTKCVKSFCMSDLLLR